MEKYQPYFSSAFDRFLLLLKKQGLLTAAQVAGELGITAEGARFQLQKLADEGLVEARLESRGVGRPVQRWGLTERGNARFPDMHADFSLHLIDAVKQMFGAPALDTLIEQREISIREKYQQAIEATDSLEEKINKVAELRNNEGYVAEYRREKEAYLLVENHCPICAAASRCEKICQSELQTLQTILGNDVSVERTEHLVNGDRRCVYRIEKKMD
ncbi:helix-turn-helix transcriptional regulator [Deminuibacter soli]|uniref:Transcriptional regulator n=1 Tax=Deminuibacter soli TaxID=2291815 RepID=A0A3E1NI47_9BACT|nr:metalloregulator ArsR/SmtB family transcription factor [Deminuibacter soli]RFM27616.1 transcriptional regulator [Deminuibacter soli]